MSADNRPTKRRKASSTISTEEDTTMMGDAARTAGREDDETIRAKIRDLLRANHAFLHGSTFTLSEMDTAHLQSLRTATPHPVQISADDSDTLPATRGVERDILTRCDITVNDRNMFLKLACKPKKFYGREGYKELYEYICQCWKSNDGYRVVLLGNAGTGKSWFQVYALKQLMSCDNDNRVYDFVIRQVESEFFLIDLDEAMVYLWEISPGKLKQLAEAMERTLYFFEPGDDAFSPPLNVNLPSLSTLSPYIQRIKEYGKRHRTTVYFWPWSLGELRALIEDSNLGIEQGIYSRRYHKFGGVLRHVLGEDRNVEAELEARLQEIDINILFSTNVNIDRDTTGANVSGFLVCYDYRSKEGNDRFAEKILDYTSAYVVEQVQNKILTLSVKDAMKNVLIRLSDTMMDLSRNNRFSETKIDFSGKNLEWTARVLLAQGREFRWQRIEVGTNPAVWGNYQVTQRGIIIAFDLYGNFHQSGKIIAPKNPTFPVVDFVFSWPRESPAVQPVVAFQCTWAERHEVKLSALCTLRRKHMKISDNQALEIYMVCPNNEDKYASRTKQHFLIGELTRDLRLDAKTIVKATELQTMWNNTKLFVIRPESSWQRQINAYLENH